MAIELEQNFHIEEKVLEFEVELLDAQFNSSGRYFLRLSTQSLATKDYSQVQLKKENSSNFIFDSEVITDVVNIEDATKNCNFQDKHFTFRLPKGFLKNDKNHDVFLLVEAFTLPQDENASGRKVGEGKVAIYPRTNAPRINTHAKVGENMYRFTDIMTIRRTLSSDELKMHCGRLKCIFALRECVPTAPPTPESTQPKFPEVNESQQEPLSDRMPMSPPPQKSSRVASPASARVSVQPSVTPSNSSWKDVNETPQSTRTPPPRETRRSPATGKMMESPLPRDQRAWFNSHPGGYHVARLGKHRIDILVHGAISLPYPSDGSVPQPYAIVKSESEEGRVSSSAGCTHACVHPTLTPLWEELVSMEIDRSNADEETLVLMIGDKDERESLVTYRIPLAYLQPYHQYHLELVMPSKNGPYGTRTYISLTRKLDALPMDPGSPSYNGLEVLLCAAEKPLSNPVGPLIAVARVVPDGSLYRDDNLNVLPRAAGVTLTTVTCPSPHPSSFTVPAIQSLGYPQITLHGYPESQPVWNHHFLFCEQREKATVFTPNAALFIEYYAVNEVISDMIWRLRNPVGFSTLPLDESVYRQLRNERGRLGLRVEGLPIQGSPMVTKDNRTPTVGLILRLITTERPDQLVSVSEPENLPVLQMSPEIETPPETNGEYVRRSESPEVMFVDQSESVDYLPESPSPPRKPPSPPKANSPKLYKQRVLRKPVLPIKDDELPPFDAMESVLPEYQYIFVDPNQRQPQEDHRPTEIEPVPPALLDSQEKELENYQAAVKKMGTDILTLREQIRELEKENSKLRRELTHYDDNTRMLMDSSDLGNMPRAELVSRYASLKQKLNSQTSDLKTYKDRVQTLQNDIIKKNDKEKEYQKVRDAHLSQQDLLFKFQEKAKKVTNLEEACRKQEKVIEKMERLLDRRKDNKNKENLHSDTQDALLEENRRLRHEMASLKDQTRSKAEPSGSKEDSEKLDLYQALDKSEGRIMSLEKQLAENSRQWGRERAELLLRLTETDHGFGRPGVSPAPMRYSFPGVKEPRRYSKAPSRNKFVPKMGSYY